MIGVTGATGHLGRLVISSLLGKVAPSDVVALVRSPEKASDLGVAARLFDYGRPETLAPSLNGIDRLLLISSSEVEQREAQHTAVVDAAVRAGVKLIVYTSILRADTSPLGTLAREHLKTEVAIRASGLPFVILRNGWYTENYSESVGGALAHGVVVGAAGDGRIATAPRADYAEAAAVALAANGPAGKVYELAGDTAFSMAEYAAELSRLSGKPITYRNLPQAEYAATLASFGLPEGFAGVLAEADAGAAEGGLFDDGRQLSTLIGRRTTPWQETLAAALKR